MRSKTLYLSSKHKQMSKLKTSDYITIIATIFSIIVSIVIWRYSGKIDANITNQYLQIKHFDSLLGNSNKEISKLDEQNEMLSKQIDLLKANNTIVSDAYTDSKDNQYYKSFRASIAEIDSDRNFYFPKTKFDRNQFDCENLFNAIEIPLKRELSNPFLDSNHYLYKKWLTLYDSIKYYASLPQVRASQHQITMELRQANEVFWLLVESMKYIKKDKRYTQSSL
jgi:hypothetical protein